MLAKKQEMKPDSSVAVNWDLRPLHNLQGLRRLQPLAQNSVSIRYLGDGIGVNHVGPMRQRVAEGNLNVLRARVKREMLVADGCCPAVLGYSDDNNGQIEAFSGTVRDLKGAVNPIVVNHWRLMPFQQKR